MKKVLSLVLALVMILSCFAVSVAASDIESDCTMKIGETRTVYLPGAVYSDYVIVKFAPNGSGLVAISSDSAEGAKSDPVLEVYNDQMNELLAKADDNGTDRDFYLEFDCEAGEVYYLAMYNVQDATSWNVSIECFHEKYGSGICLTCFEPCDHKSTDNLVGCCPCGEVYPGEEIADGDEVLLSSDTEYYWFQFNPVKTAAYLITSDNTDDETTINEPADPAVVVVDMTGDNILVVDDDIDLANDEFNFALPYMFEKGETYYIGVYDNEELSDKWTLSLELAETHSYDVTETVENEDGTTTEVTTTVTHELTYLPEVEATCQADGHSTALYCAECDEYLAGNNFYEMAEECKDDDENNICDWCNTIINEEEPVECDCDCHKTGIVKFFWDIKIFFQKLFRLNSVCSCGVAHY